MSQLPQGFTTRPATENDLKKIVALYNEYWETLTGIIKFSVDDFKNILSTPGFDMASSMLVVLSPENEMVAGCLVIDLGDPPIHPNFYGCVQKEYEGQGIGSYLLQWGEERSKKAIEKCPDNARVSMYVQTNPSHSPSVNLFREKGLNPIRYNWIMMRSLDEILPEPVWPDDIQVVTYDKINDLEALIDAQDDAFKDHWGYVDRSGDEERIKRIKHQIENDEDHDPTLWFIAMDGDQIAGLSRCSSKLGTDRETGMVDILGVRRPWRKKGLGLALLHHSFREFLQRGYKRVALGVDSQNLSGATRLYKKAGMEVDRELVVYEKELRAGEELSKQV